MVGGDLNATDEWTTSLLTNPEVIQVDQHSTGNRPAVVTDKTVVWVAKSEDKKFQYVAAFNRGSEARDAKYSWKELGLEGNECHLRDLWDRKEKGKVSELVVKLPAHGCALFRLSR